MNLLRTKKDKQQFQKWINALRSGQYKQTIKTLQDENGYCCLGVACKVLIPKNKQELNDNKFLKHCFPYGQEHAPIWLKDINNDFREKAKNALSALNDYKQLTFDEIADVLEAVYIHKVLE